MNTTFFNGKAYAVDNQGFLADHEQWDETFAYGIAPELNIAGGLNENHWKVIHFIRDRFQETGECPLVYEACRQIGATSKKMKELFPSGYLRGACRLAGITYANRRVNYYGEESSITLHKSPNDKGQQKSAGKIYATDVFGFLVDHRQWDEDFAAHRIAEMGVKGGYSKEHWKIIDSLRKSYEETNIVPSVFKCCEDNDISLEKLESLFPSGYHRGAVKASGLRVKKSE